jgi:hypothetical protein
MLKATAGSCGRSSEFYITKLARRNKAVNLGLLHSQFCSRLGARKSIDWGILGYTSSSTKRRVEIDRQQEVCGRTRESGNLSRNAPVATDIACNSGSDMRVGKRSEVVF